MCRRGGRTPVAVPGTDAATGILVAAPAWLRGCRGPTGVLPSPDDLRGGLAARRAPARYTPLGAYHLGSGSLLWRTPWPVAVEAPCAIGDHVLVAETGTGRIRRIDPRTGTDVGGWRLPEPVLSVDAGPVFRPLDADRILIRGESGAVWVLPVSSGAVRRLAGVPEDTRGQADRRAAWCRPGPGAPDG